MEKENFNDCINNGILSMPNELHVEVKKYMNNEELHTYNLTCNLVNEYYPTKRDLQVRKCGLYDLSLEELLQRKWYECNHLICMCYLIEEKGLRKEHLFRSTIRSILETCDIDLIKYLFLAFEYTSEDIRASYNEILYTSVFANRLNLVRFIIETYNLKEGDLCQIERGNYHDSLMLAAHWYMFDIIRYFIEYFNLNIGFIRFNNCDVLAYAVDNENLEMIDYLVNRYNLNFQDITLDNRRSHSYSPFHLALICNSVKIVHYFIDKFRPSLEEIRHSHDGFGNLSLKYSSMHGDLDTMKYIVETYNLTVNDIRGNDRSNYPLRKAVKYGNIKTVKYLVNTFNLTTEDIRSKNNYALRKTPKRGCVKLIKFLMNTFHLTKEDVKTNDYEMIQYGLYKRSYNIVKYVVNRFHITKEELLSYDNLLKYKKRIYSFL